MIELTLAELLIMGIVTIISILATLGVIVSFGWGAWG